MQSHLVVTSKCHNSDLPKLKPLQELLKPDEFTHGGCHGPILYLSTRPRNRVLLLTFSRDKIASNKYAIPNSGTPIGRRTCPISI